MADKELISAARSVLQNNNCGDYTKPAPKLYPHQWLWDSCFIAIGIRHYDIDRAQTEIASLLAGQWDNGMIPHMIFNRGRQYRRDRNVWRSWLSPQSPNIPTSGITQPPLLAEAAVRIGAKLSKPERRSWYKQVWPALLDYHFWIYHDRDPHGEGLVLQIHPWETGLDNTPPWIFQLNEHTLPWWITLLKKTGLHRTVSLLRRDTRFVPAEQRYSNIEALTLFDAQRRLRAKAYDIGKILDRSLFAIEDLTFNSVLIRANTLLGEIAATIGEAVPPALEKRMQKTVAAFDELWDPYAQSYFSRDFINHELLKQQTIAALMPLYAGHISKKRAAIIVKMLENEHLFGPAYPVPSVPLNSDWYNPHCYWQGPTWINMNWMIIDGLRRYGYKDHAAALAESSLELVKKQGFYEYFDPETGEGLGSSDFSWTAALAIDLSNHD